MNFKALLLSALLLPFGYQAFSQTCTTLGQNPNTAFPVCGVDTFSQTIVPPCGGRLIPVPCTDNAGYSDIRPFWYKFTCFTGGTLGLQVTPIDFNDDYDWQIFDITGKNPMDVYTDASMFVACNWSSNPGTTGTNATSNSLVNCAGPTYPNMSKMPTLIQGHEYLLLLSNFSPSQKGYSLTFKGGTASITDPKLPALSSAESSCGGVKAGVKLNKKMKCASIAADGSDFTLSPALASIVSISGVGCNAGFDTDSLEVVFSVPLPPGNYTLTAKNGTDANTILDNCDRDIPVGSVIGFTVFPIAPTPLDSLSKIGCEPDQLQLVFRKGITCASVTASGSEFIITGPSAVTVAGATITCGANGTSKIIQVKLAGKIQLGGQYQLILQQGTDGNTLLDECGQATPAGSSINFTVADTVNADFSYVAILGCKVDTVTLTHPGGNGVNSWTWWADGQIVSNQPSHTIYYTQFGQKTYKLKVSNGVCADSTTTVVDLNNTLKAAFTFPDVVCPEDMAVFTDQSIGATTWNWNFGNGFTSTDKNPAPFKYNPPTNTREIFYTARLIVGNNANCADTISHIVKAVNTCKIAVPNAFTPNNDGRNDYLYPLNAYKADNLVFRVYNRFGQMVFETKDWTKKWDGTVNGQAQPTGTFVWTLQYIDRDTKQAVFKKGTTVIIR